MNNNKQKEIQISVIDDLILAKKIDNYHHISNSE